MTPHHDLEPGPSDVLDELENLRCDEAEARPSTVYGMCTACGAVEVALLTVTGTRDLSGIGEHHAYPVGYGCEVCS